MSNVNDLVAWLRDVLDREERRAQGDIEYSSLPGVHEYAEQTLREVKAKRAVLDAYEAAFDRTKRHPGDVATSADALAMVRVVRLLALPLDDRPGYQERWRP